MLKKSLIMGLLVGAVACRGGGGPKHDPIPSGQSATPERLLNARLDDLWRLDMETWPTWATYEGIRDYDDRLADVSDEAYEEYVSKVEAIAREVEAIDPAPLDPVSRDTREMVLLNAERLRAGMVCHSSWWDVSGLGGPQVDYPMLPVFFPIRNETDLANLGKRYAATAEQIEQTIANLRRGLDQGYAPTKTNVARATEQLDRYLESPLDEDPMLNLKYADDVTPLDDARLRTLVKDVVRPALARYRDFLKKEVVPAARPDHGIADLPTGRECYAARMQSHIGPGYNAADLHQRGLDELKRLHAGMVEVGKELGLQDPTAGDVMKHMAANTSYYASSEQELLEKNRAAVDRARAAMPLAFGRIPKADVEVRPLEKHRAADAPAAYYYGAPEDGSRPGIYYVNTSEPETRPLFNLEALAYHEAIPGHHLQIALAKEIPDTHVWRRNAGQTAYVEGWALYAEVLSDELGLYSDPVTRFGMYNYQAWRAARLVIDTGLHDKGWTRQQAIDFLTENTALPAGEIANEVDRYIAWPGQALAYMVGRLAIEDLRARARQRLGDAFSLRDFHDAVHQNGAVPLTILRQNIETWMTNMDEKTENLPNFKDLWNFDDPAATEAKFREVLSKVPEGNQTYRLQLLTQIARTYSLRKEFEKAHATLDDVKNELDSAEPVVRVRYLLERGRSFNSAGQKDEAKRHFREAWDVARRARLDGLAVDAAHMMGIAEEPKAAIEWNLRAMAYAEQSDDPDAKGWLGALYNNMGWTYHDEGQFERALELFEKGLAWRREQGKPVPTRIAKWSVGRALRSLGRHEEALKLQLELEAEWSNSAEKQDGFVYEELGELYLATGDEAKAQAYFAKAYPLLSKLDWIEESRLKRLQELSETTP